MKGKVILIGLEYIMNLFLMPHVELANKLGIRKQNIYLWIKRKQNIPKKYLPHLEEIFCIDRIDLIKELNEEDKLRIHAKKLIQEQRKILKSIKNNKDYLMNDDDIESLENARECLEIQELVEKIKNGNPSEYFIHNISDLITINENDWKLIIDFNSLNEDGRKRLLDNMQDLLKIKEYCI